MAWVHCGSGGNFVYESKPCGIKVVTARRKRAAAEPLPTGLTPELLDQWVAGAQTPTDIQVVWRQLQKALAERVLKAQLTHELGYPVAGERGPDGRARNGATPKRLLSDSGALDLDIPCDRLSSCTPQFVPKCMRRLPGFDETVLILYPRDLSTRELEAFLEERYQVPVSTDLISTITSEVSGFRIALREGAYFWHRVIRELHCRGVGDILIAQIDGLTGLPDAQQAVFPLRVIHQCGFRLMAITRFGRSRSPVSLQADHPFRTKPITP